MALPNEEKREVGECLTDDIGDGVKGVLGVCGNNNEFVVEFEFELFG